METHSLYADNLMPKLNANYLFQKQQKKVLKKWC